MWKNEQFLGELSKTRNQFESEKPELEQICKALADIAAAKALWHLYFSITVTWAKPKDIKLLLTLPEAIICAHTTVLHYHNAALVAVIFCFQESLSSRTAKNLIHLCGHALDGKNCTDLCSSYERENRRHWGRFCWGVNLWKWT